MAPRINPGFHRSPRAENCWHIGTHSCQDHPRRNFIAVGDVKNTIEPMGIDDCFSWVSNQFTTWQWVTHPDMSHGDSIIYPNCIEFKRDPPGFSNGFFGNICQFSQMDVTRYDIDIRVANGNKRLIHILDIFYLSCCIKQTPCWSCFNAFFYLITSQFHHLPPIS